MKKLISVFLVIVIFCGIVPVIDVSLLYVEANAASVEGNIQLLRTKFPDGKFWNHKTNNYHNNAGVYATCTNPACTNPDGWTDYPCSSHNGVVGIGGYDCNNFDNAIQCMGFAKKLFFDVHGVYVSSIAARWDIYNVGIGDYVRVNGDSHSALVIGRSGNTITVAECNLYGAGNECRIKWGGTYDVSCIDYFCHSDAVGTSLHRCSYGNTYVCSECGSFDSASITITKTDQSFQIIKDNAIDHTGPYGACTSVNSHPKNTVVTATEKIVNGYGHTWYKLTNGKYIYSDYLKKYTAKYIDLTAGDYWLRSLSTNKYLIVDGGQNVNAQNVSVWNFSSSAKEEQWSLSKDSLGYILTTKLGYRVLNPYVDNVVTPGSNVTILNAGNGDKTQRWSLELVMGGYVIRNITNPSCVLTVNDGNNVIMDTYRVGDWSQIWQFEPVYSCTHNWNSSFIVETATCVDTGIRQYSCSNCDSVMNEIIPVKAEHEYDNGVIKKTGTCKTEGEILYSCKDCDHTYTEKTGYGSIHANLQCVRSGAYGSVSKMSCKSCGAEYTYDLGVRSVTVTPLSKNEIKVRIEFVDNRNVIKNDYISVPATAVSEILPNGVLFAGEKGKIKSHSVSGNVYTGTIEFSDAALKNLVGDKHSFFLEFKNKDDPSNKYGYVRVVFEWQQGHYSYLKVGESVDVKNLLGIDTAGYSLCNYNTDVVEYKNGIATAKKDGTAYILFVDNMRGNIIGCTVVVEADVMLGDIDGNDKITANDARLILRGAVKLENFDDKQKKAADIDKNGEVTASDARYALRYSVNLIDSIWK